MGMIRIHTWGSFARTHDRTFSAMQGGHADAVAQAIEFLAKDVLPRAIEQDHKLQAEGAHPEIGFGKRTP
jgi:mRNA-degrading endonuclease YafQ of YafQ-DinJ toxin-antitoxin module